MLTTVGLGLLTNAWSCIPRTTATSKVNAIKTAANKPLRSGLEVLTKRPSTLSLFFSLSCVRFILPRKQPSL
jgi:hypothetical protein